MDLQTSPISAIALENDSLLQVIDQLQGQADADLSSKNLAALTGRNPTNMSRTLDRMVEAGLILRFLGGKPELTDDGRAALEALNRARNAALTEGGVAEGGVSTGVHADFARNPDQPRKKFDPAKLEQMADTIEEGGVIKPLLVFPKNEAGVRIIWDGERRWRAAGIVNQRFGNPNQVRIPYVERAPTEAERGETALIAEAAELALVANGQGEDLTSYEKAVALRAMVPTRYPSARAAAKAIGVHEKTAQDWLKALADLPADILALWKADELGWREVRDKLRPAPAKPIDADPAQIDIEEVTGARNTSELSAHDAAVRRAIRADLAKVTKSNSALLVAIVELADACWSRPFDDSGRRTATWLTPQGPAALLYKLLSPAGLMVSWVDGQQVTSIHDDALGWLADNGLLTAPGSRERVLTTVRNGCSISRAVQLKPGEYMTPGLNAPSADQAKTAAQSHMDQLVQGFSEKLELGLLEVEDKASKDPQVLTDGKGKRTEGWASLSEKPTGGALPTLIERALLEIDHLGDRWFIRVVPGGEGAAWIAEHNLAGVDGRLARAGRLYQLRAKIMGENVASQLAAQRLRYSASCLNTVRPEDIETAQLLKEAQAETVAKLEEIDRKKARENLTALEVAWALWAKAGVANDGTDGETTIRVGEYWLDASASALVDRKLIRFTNLGGEAGWVVRAGAALAEWLPGQGIDLTSHQYDWGDVVYPIQVALGLGLPADRDETWTVPWLNIAETSEAPTGDELGGQDHAEDLDDGEAAEEAAEIQAKETLGRVVDFINEPTSFGELLDAVGLKLPLRVCLTDTAVVCDASGEAVFTVDQDRALPDAQAAARALLIAAAVNRFAIGREITDRAPADVITPEKMTPREMRRSIFPDHLVCLEDGRRFTDLIHHLRVEHDMEWGEYLARWKLPNDYPSVAPATDEERHLLARNNAHEVLRRVGS